MKKIFITSLFVLATLAWAVAQQPGSMPAGDSGQATSPSSQAGASQSQPSTSGGAGQDAGQPGTQGGPQGAMASPQVTEGCLGGSSPNYTVTDKTGTTYKLNIPPTADASKLAAHVGESVDVAGNISSGGSPSIDVRGIGKGTGTCPAAARDSAQPPPKQ